MLGLLGAGSAALLVGCGTGGQTAASTAGSVAASGSLNAKAQTAVALSSDPAAQASAAAEVATVEATNAALDGTACVIKPEMTEGPYFLDERINRSDIRSDPDTGAVKAGAPLVITFTVSQLSGDACTPLAGATVDVWH